MDMGSSSMSMSISPSIAITSPVATSSASTMGAMGGMGGNSCKISMLWNWYTVGACFISKTWQVTSDGMFAGSCIGVICLVISLEFLRRLQREHDAFIKRRMVKTTSRVLVHEGDERHSSSESSEEGPKKNKPDGDGDGNGNGCIRPAARAKRHQASSKTTLLRRQFLRAFLHMLQFGVAYFIMLLAMYYNGFIIICILIGAFLGCFIFSWDQLLNDGFRDSVDVTGCCG